jgi:hypothetical protein
MGVEVGGGVTRVGDSVQPEGGARVSEPFSTTVTSSFINVHRQGQHSKMLCSPRFVGMPVGFTTA